MRAPLVREPPSCAVFEPKILSPDHFQPPFYRLNFVPFSNGFVASTAIIYQHRQLWEQLEAIWYLFYTNVVWQTIILAYFNVYISYILEHPPCARFLGRFSCLPKTAHEGGMTVWWMLNPYELQWYISRLGRAATRPEMHQKIQVFYISNVPGNFWGKGIMHGISRCTV